MYAADTKAAENKAQDGKVADAKSADSKDAENKPFVVPGKFSIGSPEKDIQWKKLQDINAGDFTGVICVYVVPTSKQMAFLYVIYKKLQSDKDRQAWCQSAYASFKQGMPKGKVIVLESPKLDSKIPDQVKYICKVQKADNTEGYCICTVIFGKGTYQINISAQSEKEAKDLHDKLVKSFKELEK
ncbi:MAG: hypothetical protein ABSA77_05315 [Thermoguttaceae bacterium]